MAKRLASVGAGFRAELLVLPIASVENHGVLPLGADYLLAECVAERIVHMLGEEAAVAPVLAYTTAVEHEVAGPALGASPTTLTGFLLDIAVSAASLAESVAIVAFHGGAFFPAYVAAREARRRTGSLVVVESFWSHVSRVLSERYGIDGYPIHADPVEASLLLACGHRVGVREAGLAEVLEEARKRAERLRRLPSPWLGSDDPDALYPSEPVPANRVFGEELLEEAVRGLAERLEELLSRTLGGSATRSSLEK